MAVRLGRSASIGCPVPMSRGMLARRGPQRLAVSASTSTAPLWSTLDDEINYYKTAPPSEKDSAAILSTYTKLAEADGLKKWGDIVGKPVLNRRNLFPNELKQVGILDPAAIGVPSVRNDAAFLGTVVIGTSLVAVLAGIVLPGEWGFWGTYLSGGISIAVLAIGSTAPGLLQVFINKFSTVFPDYRERVVRHEAAHFLTAYLAGVPVTGYSLDIGKEHTDLAEAKLQRKVYQGKLEEDDLNQLAVVSMAGIASEATKFEEIVGQNADLMDLQRMMNKSATKLSDSQQQNLTRWAVYSAASVLRTYPKEYDALIAAMEARKSVSECIKAIESA